MNVGIIFTEPPYILTKCLQVGGINGSEVIFDPKCKHFGASVDTAKMVERLLGEKFNYYPMMLSGISEKMEQMITNKIKFRI